MTSDELRVRFLRYFQERNHTIRPSTSLVPTDDPTLLFTSAGMVPFKSYFLGQDKSLIRAVSCQRCFRTSDIEEVGKTNRHHTFFEMLGNFSFGDYFKEEAIAWAWEFLTKELALPGENFWISVYKDDDEAVRLWSKIGLRPERIVRLGEESNFWKMGEIGPCGPCSEILIDQGKDIGCGRSECSIECSCDRFLELWNLVFTQFDCQLDGELKPLPKPNIDTGMGLERLACVMQEKKSNFETDLLFPIIERIIQITRVEHKKDEKKDTALRIIADHIRSLVFLAYDRVYPENVGRGYVWRSVLRRASWQGRHHLKIQDPFLYQLVPVVINIFPSVEGLLHQREYISKIIHMEEERFIETLNLGEPLLCNRIRSSVNKGEKTLSGKDIFELYDTHGLPVELIKEVAREEGLSLDEEGFRREMELQQMRSRAFGTSFKSTVASSVQIPTYQTEFIGYEEFTAEAKIIAIIKDGLEKEKAKSGEEVEIILDKTPFYAEAGGQVGDTGMIIKRGVKIEVFDTQPATYGHIHRAKILEGEVSIGDTVMVYIDLERRRAIERNHTATHLLQAALRQVLGHHVKQSGSLVAPDYLRFDFTHLSPLEEQEVIRVQDLVNKNIWEDIEVSAYQTSIEEAKREGAIALFEAEYTEEVRAVRIKEVSLELCGGTHLKRTGQMGLFKVVTETGAASGVRRIEAITGEAAYKYVRREEETIEELNILLKTKTEDLIKKTKELIVKNKDFEKKIKGLNLEIVKSQIGELTQKATILNGVRILCTQLLSMDALSLREAADLILSHLKEGVVVLAAVDEERINWAAKIDKGLASTIHAGRLINEIAKITGGGGGGRSDFAQAGGVRLDRIDEALKRGFEIIEEVLRGDWPLLGTEHRSS